MNKVYCTAPWNGLTIREIGDVRTCCVGAKALGNINNTDIKEIQNSQQLLDKFWQDNMWTRELFPQAKARQYPIFNHLQSYTIKTWLENILTKFSIHIWNRVARWGQMQKIKSNSIQSNNNNRIQVSDTELEFHPEPNSIKVEQVMQTILQQIG